ncbi:hypothetical protein H8E88_02775 [candidate division KSB1 bacterium]|nr:hypothetical protein [candidate division KSB1 bacterium]
MHEDFTDKLEKFEKFISEYALNYTNSTELDDDKLIRLWAEKRQFALKVHNLLLTSVFAVEKNDEEINYKDRFAEIQHSEVDQNAFYKIISDNYFEYDIGKNIKDFESFLSSDYNPPYDNLPELVSHIFTLFLYYNVTLSSRIFLTLPASFIQRVDFVMTRLAERVGLSIACFSIAGRDEDRTSKASKAKAKEKAGKKQKVIETYYTINNRDRLSIHRIAKIIRDRLESKGEKPPVIQTIKNYLEEDGIL